MPPGLLEFLATLPDLGARPQGGMRSTDFTLDRIRALLGALGNPPQAYPSLHVAGTNGKGSVCALCAAALQAAGYKVGLFTSPHVEGALHSISVSGKRVSIAELEAAFRSIEPQLAIAEGWTQFEIVTALAFLHFALAKVDVAVIEVGLGGRLDATNVIIPMVAVITSIDFDHTAILGNTLTQIATEKAGIIKPGVPLVMAPQPEEARQAILAVAQAQGVPVIGVGKEILFERIHYDLGGQDLRVWPIGKPNDGVDLHIALLGSYQIENAATAYAALSALNGQGLQIDQAAIQESFASARWPGRFELLQAHPPLVLDAAHSPAAARALRASLDEYFPGRPLVTVLGVSADKDLEGLLAPLRERLGELIATQSSHARAMPAIKLADLLGYMGIRATAEPDPAAAVRLALSKAESRSVILVAGSVFLVEAVRTAFMHSS